MRVGTVRTFANVSPDKEQALKVLEEAAEVYAAWQAWLGADLLDEDVTRARLELVDEMADVIQATCNLAAAMGLSSLELPMARCECRNRERGRYGE